MNIQLREIQDYPLSDSPNNDAFEAIVELYYQIKGYITSSGKWFWVLEEGKSQRGYQDIDVVAVNEKETVIVSATVHIEDKVSGQKFNDTCRFFDKVKEYFKNVSEYQWLSSKRIKRVIAYEFNYKTKKKKEEVQEKCRLADITLLPIKDIEQEIKRHLKRDHLKIQNQMLRIVQVIEHLKE